MHFSLWEKGKYKDWERGQGGNEQNCIPKIISTSALVAPLEMGWNYRALISPEFQNQHASRMLTVPKQNESLSPRSEEVIVESRG